MTRRIRRTLPPMGRPYEGIQLLLELVAHHNPKLTELDELVRQRSQDYLPGLTYSSGKEDILYFCYRQLGLFTSADNRFWLSDSGRGIYRDLQTPEFDMSLFLHIVERSRENFAYFYRVYDALEAYAQRGEFEIPLPVFNSLLLEKSNKWSSKEIRNLLIGCGAVQEKDNAIAVVAPFFLVDLKQKQLERLWEVTAQILQKEGRLIYPELVAKLRGIYPSMDWHELETAFRSGLVLSKTRASEFSLRMFALWEVGSLTSSAIFAICRGVGVFIISTMGRNSARQWTRGISRMIQ